MSDNVMKTSSFHQSDKTAAIKLKYMTAMIVGCWFKSIGPKRDQKRRGQQKANVFYIFSHETIRKCIIAISKISKTLKYFMTKISNVFWNKNTAILTQVNNCLIFTMTNVVDKKRSSQVHCNDCLI